jgi:uncharacterized protein
MIRGRVLERRRAEQSERIGQARGYVEALAREIPVRAAVVFGSVARGDFNLWSDTDLLLVSEAFAGAPRARDEQLGRWPAGVQPIAWTPDEWHVQLARRNPIAREAAERGVWLRGGVADLESLELGGAGSDRRTRAT